MGRPRLRRVALEGEAVKRAAATLGMILALAAAPARAHIGVPNVYYQGSAGPYQVLVIVRPPGVIPGLAEITVRVESADPVTVSTLPVHASTGREGSPPPDRAAPVRGAPNVHASQLWLMERGAYSVFVEVGGPAGSGTAIVPVNAIATERLPMPAFLGALLAALGVLLVAGVLSIAVAAAREATLEPGAPPGLRPGRLLAVLGASALVAALALWGGKRWWDAVDREYRTNRMYRPIEVRAEGRVEGEQRIVELELRRESRRQWSRIVPDHGKLMHMFLVREPGLDAFAHVHPVPRGDAAFEVAVPPPLPAGAYRIYADITHEDGLAETLTSVVDVPALPEGATGSSIRLEADPDDSWSILSPAAGPDAAAFALEDGRRMVWEGPDSLAEGREVSLRFSVLDPDGRPVHLEPYMGMLGHAAVRRDDGAVFAHLHPTGTISMASQEIFQAKEAGGTAAGSTASTDSADHSGHLIHAMHAEATTRVAFPFEFPRPGRYRLWVQVKAAGKVLTGIFDATVAPGR
jgi:hypothetical protein